MSISFEISAGRVGRFTPFSPADNASRRKLLSKETVAELTRKKEWLEKQLQRIMVTAAKGSKTYSPQDFIENNKVEAWQAFLLRDRLRDVEIVLAYKLQEHERLKRVKEEEKKRLECALFGADFVSQKAATTERMPFIKQPRKSIKHNPVSGGRR
ncbi:MAG: hypothetical protein EBU90_05290 [Proteobacteria bacterium]|nr:hypothetical protein [Pseudomonadota bacterium]NBP15712.1 hypothetical protein [bacterium]